MQTFLPYESFTRSARVLDQQRLGKQRVECLQVLNVFAGVRKGWGNHPITRMWTGYELSLVKYGLTICKVWRDERGFNDTCYGKIRSLFDEATMGQFQRVKDAFDPADRINAGKLLPNEKVNIRLLKPGRKVPQ